MNATGRESEWFVLNAPFHRGKFLCQQSHVADHLALFAELVWLPSVVSRHGGVTGNRRCVMVRYKMPYGTVFVCILAVIKSQ